MPNNESHLRTLRNLMPMRPLSFSEALQRAELQAARLLELAGITDAPTPDSVIADQPRVIVELDYGAAQSGRSQWRDHAWRIQLNAFEPEVRRRFTLAHEYKHLLDAPTEAVTYQRLRGSGDRHPLIEQVCDYFAACLLMPKRLVKRAWGEGARDAVQLADLFVVSPRAMHIRLLTLGLIERPTRCGHAAQRAATTTSHSRPKGYERSRSHSIGLAR